MPSILASLQKSVHGVVLGKTVGPDWITHGVPESSLLTTFTVSKSSEPPLISVFFL